MLDQVLQKPGIGCSIRELATATNAQRLVNGAFELAVLLFNVAVLVRHAEVVGGRFQTIVGHQHAVALFGLASFFGIQRVNRRAQVISAVLARRTADLPHAPFEPFDQRLEAFRKTDLDRLDVRVHQHQVVHQVRKGHTAQRHAQAGHVREVGLRSFTRFVDLRKDHLAVRTILSSPGRDMPLQRAQLALLIPTRVALAQQPEERLALERRVVLQERGDPRPVLSKWVGTRAIRARLLELAG